MAARSGFSFLLAPGFNETYTQNQDIKQWPTEYDKFLMVDSSDRQYEEDALIVGFGTMPEKEEREAVIFDDPIQAPKKRYTMVTYALGFRVSEELWEDDLTGKMKQMPKELRFSANDVVEVVSAGILNTGFTDSAAYLGPDGEPLFGDGTTLDHPLLGGGRWQNQLSVAADLSADSLELMLNLIDSAVNDRGLTVHMIAKLLIVPVQLRMTAKELLLSELKPFTDNNEINPFKDMDLEYMVSHYLTDPDAWFIQCQLHYMKFFWRVKSKNIIPSDDFYTGDALFKARQRLAAGYSAAQGIYGSPGGN